MENHQLFLAFLNKFISLEEEEYNRIIKPHTQLRQFKKKTVITQAGEVERYLNFVVQGLVRKYFKKDEEEVITQISREGQIIHSQGSFHKQKPSYYIVETIEPTTMLSIDFESLNAIFSSGAKMERMAAGDHRYYGAKRPLADAAAEDGTAGAFSRLCTTQPGINAAGAAKASCFFTQYST